MTSRNSDPIFTVVYSSFNAWEAELVRHALEREDIESFIDNDHIVQANWLYSNAVGGVRVRVHSRDAERAVEIIRALEGQERTDEPFGPEIVEDADEPASPGSKGERKRLITWSGLAAVGSWFLLGVPLLFRRGRNRNARSKKDQAE